jgi:hypothetical protein
MNKILLAALLALLVLLLYIDNSQNHVSKFDNSTNKEKNNILTDEITGVQYICDDYGMCYKYSPIMTADNKGTPLYRGNLGLGRYPGDEYPMDGADLSRLHTGRPDGAMGSPLDPTTLTYPELIGYFGTGIQTAYTPNEMAAMRTRDGLVHAGWVNNQQPGYVLTNSDRWNTNYKYQVGSSIQVVS